MRYSKSAQSSTEAHFQLCRLNTGFKSPALIRLHGRCHLKENGIQDWQLINIQAWLYANHHFLWANYTCYIRSQLTHVFKIKVYLIDMHIYKMNIYIYTLSFFFLIGGEFLSLQKWDVRGPHHELSQKTETKEWEVVFDMCSRESNELAVRKPDSRPGPAPCCVTFTSGSQFLHLWKERLDRQLLSHLLVLRFYYKLTEPLHPSI